MNHYENDTDLSWGRPVERNGFKETWEYKYRSDYRTLSYAYKLVKYEAMEVYA